MSDAGKRLIEGAEEALRVAKGEQPAASIWHNGFEYVPRHPSRNDVLEEAARMAYRVCAETRHVTLGDRAADAIRALKDRDG